MSSQLRISAGQYSSAGRKPTNQDFHGLCIPREPLLSAKGIAVALADGISSSEAGQIASEAAVKSFLTDYYCTAQAWSVKRSAQRVLAATNAWLHAHTQRGQGRFDKERGHVCTFSALILRSTTAHLFHVGDTRIHRLHGQALEQLTTDHRVVVAPDESYLSRALGIWQQIDLDYQALPLEVGDTFVLTSDGVHEQMDGAFVAATVARLHDDLDLAARTIVEEALRRGSDDNLTVQIVRIDALPDPEAAELPQLAAGLRPPPLPEPGALLDGYRIVRELHASHRSHLYLVQDEESGERLVMKVPSIDMREDAAYLERFLLEEWVARRIHSPHVLRAAAQRRQRSALYVTLEYLDGQTLAQWMADHPTPELETVRGMVEQIARGLQAFHRMEMVHQDLRPENVMIDREGTLKIIDFGATRVASVMELLPEQRQHEMLGTLQYSAPECLLAEGASNRSDLFSLGVIAYQMLTGRLPYGTQVARLRRHTELRKLRYVPLYELDRRIPVWVDGALRKAVHPDPRQRYEEVSEFVWDLRHPNPAFLGRHRPPLIERNPLAFWKGVSLLLLVLLLVLLASHPALR